MATSRTLRWFRARLYALPADGPTAGWVRARNADDQANSKEQLDDADDVAAFLTR